MIKENIDQTQTTEFKNWFGDSKVVDGNGNPLVVYHGTDVEFDEFDESLWGSSTDEGDYGLGFYFTDDIDYAKTYGKNVYSVYLKINNPYIIDFEDDVPKVTQSEMINWYKESGHDGVNVMNFEEIVVFDPNQIKSATDNNGNFNPNSNVITEMEKYDFYVGELNDKVWTYDKLNEDISEQLLEIVTDFVSSLDIDIDIDDIILTGSLANMNWNKFSDFDLHILTDLDELSNNYDLNKLALDQLKNNWNTKHDIKIHDYDVEVYFQDTEEPHIASGVYSILNDEWLTHPEYDEDVDEKVDENEQEIFALFDRYEKDANLLTDINVESLSDVELEETLIALENLMDSIKKMRRDEEIGLLSDDAEFSVGNLAFKMLRNSGAIGKILETKTLISDKLKSI